MNIIIALGVCAAFVLAGFSFAAGMRLYQRLHKPERGTAKTPAASGDEPFEEVLAKSGYLASPGSPSITKQWTDFTNYDGGIR